MGTGSNEIGAGTRVAGFVMILMAREGTMVDGLSGGGFVDTDSIIEGRPTKGGVESRRWAAAGTDSAVRERMESQVEEVWKCS